MGKTHRKQPPIQTSRWHKVQSSRGRPTRLLKPLRSKSKRPRAARVRGAAVQRAGRPRQQQARGLQTPEFKKNAPAESALLGGLIDITVCRSLLSRSLFGVKRTYRFALHMSASDPKRTLRS